MLRATGGEYPEFIAAVSILFGLAPDDARAQLEQRAERLAAELADDRGATREQPRLPRLFLLEEEYRRAVLQAELAWLRGVIADLERGRLTWSEEWLTEIASAFHPPDDEQGGAGMTATIEASALHKRYRKTRALDGLDLVAEPGQVTAVLGPNGAGKTTFVRAVATLLRLDSGTLRVAGHDVRREPEAVRRHDRAGRPVRGRRARDERPREPGDGRPPVRPGPAHGTGERRARCSSRSGSVEAADRLARTYSGGMRRRLDLGASLVGAPRLLLLDEPTTGLDPRSRIELWDAIRGLVEQGTDVLLTTQYLDEADQLAEPDRDHRPRPRDRRRARLPSSSAGSAAT